MQNTPMEANMADHQNTDSNKLVTAAELADEHLSVNISTVYRLARRGVIPHVRIGKVVRFDVAAVKAALTRGR